ncbi:MAG: hypothetical protein E7235_07505 [Lachnospiraceae bacterium]|nr:hypothetical protein [Lachnospiraceae bacterium]
MEKSLLFKHYILKLCFRGMVALVIVLLFLFSPETLDFTKEFSFPVYVLFLIILVEMFLQINPLSDHISHGCLKQFKDHYECPEGGYDKKELREAIREYNKGAIKVAVVWIVPHIVIGALYFKGIVSVALLVTLSALFYLADLICVLIFCPFQRFMMHNKCCVTCRIFAWGIPMMVTPLLFINNMFSRVLCIVAFAIAIRWEIVIKRYPERFWEGSNTALRCASCTDKMCRIKKPPHNKAKQ